MLKILFNVNNLLQPDDGVRRPPRGAPKDSGVGRILILALAPLSHESRKNVGAVMTALRIEELRRAYTNAHICYAIDLKMALVMLGLRGSGACFACPYCLWSRWSKHSCPHKARSILGLSREANELKDLLADGARRSVRPGTVVAALVSHRSAALISPTT